jgi:APA family basic amino acid/polyamine antiporter
MQSLERRLGLFSVITISISSMVGSGIFVLPGIGFEITGPSLFLAFLASAIIILPAAMSKAELATAMPTSGGTYVYIERTFGPLAGTVSGLGLFFSILLKAAFALIGLGAYFSVISDAPLIPTVLSFLGFIVVLNIFGVGKVSNLLTFFLSITIISLVLLIGFSTPFWDSSNLTPLMPNGIDGVAAATGLVFVSFAGVTKVAAIAEEVRSPEKNLPRGILLSLIIVTFIYCAVSFTLANVFPASEMAGEIKPIYRLASFVSTDKVAMFIALVAVLTMVNTSNAGILAGSRFPFAMSRDRLLPSALGKLSRRFLTPVSSIILSGLIVAIVIVSLDVAKIAKLASAFMIMIYMIENFCVIVLRETRPQWYNPGYKAPLYPVLQVLGILASFYLLYAMGIISIIAIASICAPSLLFYFMYSKKRTTRKGVVSMKTKRPELIEEAVFQRHTDFYETHTRDSQVVVGVFGKERSADMLVEMGVALAEHGNIEVASIIEVPEQTTLQDVMEEPAETRSLRRRVRAMAQEKEESITFDPVVTHDVGRSIFEISQCVHCKWLLVEWRGRDRGALTLDNPVGWLKSHLHCHLAIFRDAGIRYFKSIMVVLNNDQNDKIVLETAEHLASVNKAGITLVKYVPEDTPEEVKAQYEDDFKRISENLNIASKVKIISGKDVITSMVTETIEYELLILGSKDHTFLRSIFGAFDDILMSKAACSVMAVHASTTEFN